jgi:hypothetical protein
MGMKARRNILIVATSVLVLFTGVTLGALRQAAGKNSKEQKIRTLLEIF